MQFNPVMIASRQLRPVEIVGIYETKLEGMEWELSTLRCEVRAMSTDLKETQNTLAAKDRSNICFHMPEDKLKVMILLQVEEQYAFSMAGKQQMQFKNVK